MTLYTDAFTRADTAAGTGLGSVPGGPAYEVVSGSWQILNNRAHTTTAASSRPIIVLPGGSGSCDLSATISNSGGDAVYARVSDATSWVCARLRRYTTTVSSGYTEYQWIQYYTHQDHNGNTSSTSSISVSSVILYGFSDTTPPSFPSSNSTPHTHGSTNYTTNYPKSGQPSRTTGVNSTRYVDQSYSQTAYQVILEKCVGGVVGPPLGTVSASAPTQLRLTAVGPALKVYVGGSSTAAISVVDSFNSTVARHGLGRGPSEQTGTGLDNLSLDTLNTPPNAPTLTVPASMNRTADLIVPVRFSDPDIGDSASASFLRYRLGGAGSWTVITKLSPNTDVTIPAGTLLAGSNEIQGASRDAGGLPVGDANLVWSASSFVLAATPPDGPTITAPLAGSTVGTEAFLVTWSAVAQQAFQVRTVADLAGAPDESTIYTDTGTVEGAEGALRFRTVAFPVSPRAEHVQVRVRVDGLWSAWASNPITVSYTPPAVPVVVLYENDAGGLILVSYSQPEPVGDQPNVSSVDILRRVTAVGGDGIRIATEQPSTRTYVDRTPASGVDYGYAVVAFGTNGTSTTSGWITETSDAEPPDPDAGDADPIDFTTDFEPVDFA